MAFLGTPRPTGRRAALAVLTLCLALPMGSAAQTAASPPLENAVKASYLFKFAPFIEWPAATLSSAKAFTICLRGEDNFGPVIDDVVRGQRFSGRPVLVRRLSGGSAITGCQILFAGRSAATDYAPFSDIAGQPVLTVADKASGVNGSMIQFVMQGGRVRFQIDNNAARANGLVISSKLLGLAISVDKR